ncbi:penicillin-binding transpeptidase domain-containing protein [Rossellomorea aquimaris]|uniref:penicillin-binding transpeptidase domain-containing protein n=1 Tax=Rossellomorea aquimaris TaxID=189382 RepID=UPI001CD506F1|nr:penicillin-binding transpeptidase domain-containing protein [Rossellomorea aquimaris]MCA1055273.1 penicillin-binding transpeptidase domain-containing protein [Rossellomorea aquimaris]
MGKKLLLFCVFAVLTFFIAGCQEKVQPDDRLKEYVGLWNEKKFDKMYNVYLSSSAKETYQKDDIVKRTNDIYEDLGVKGLKIQFEKTEEDKEWDKETEAQFPVTISMNTMAGEISYEETITLQKEEKDDEENWYIDWQPVFILPEMEQGDKVGIDSIAAKRGEIYDRNENPMAINGEAFQIGILPKEFNESDLEKLSSLVEMSPEAIQKELNQSWVKPEYFVPIKKLPITERPLALDIIELPGLYSKRVEARQYPYGEATSHITGYLGKINAEKLEKLKDKGYTAQSLLGIGGAEDVYEEKLRGQSGQRIYLTKESGEEVTVAEKKVENGQNITLTIDAEMQRKIYEQMKDEVGTAAAVDPKTGETLALISVPAYNPNEFALGMTGNKFDEIYNDPDQPLRNRFNKTYSPGSAMKGITASVGLKSGKLDPAKTFEIKEKRWQKDKSWGGYEVVRVFDNDSVVDLESGLKYSDNIYFARVGLEMGAETFIEGLKNFGFGEEIPMSYPIGKSQISNKGTISNEIQLADSAFGQGEVLMSVVHLASAYGGIINDGTMMKPVLLKDEEQGVWKKDLLSPEQSALMRTDLRKVVSEGIAGKAQVPGREIAGKTGTAEIKSEQGTTGKENGWFVSYDQKNPEFVLAMMLEGVEERGGSTHTVQMAQKFYSSY